MSGGGEVRTRNDLEGDMVNTLQTSNNRAAKSQRGWIGDGDEDIEGTLRVVGQHGGEDAEAC